MGGPDHKTLIDELTQGMEKAMQLRLHLCSTSPSQAQDLILHRIISTFENALLILKWGESAHVTVPQESSISVDGSPKRDDYSNNNLREHNCSHKDTSKKRKLQTIWMEQVRVTSENGLEGPADDGYSWRKYGQKDILGAKYPRSYYRCTYRHVRNCCATKQVQRSDDDPTLFDITYKGIHTCNHCSNEGPLSALPEKQEIKHNNSRYNQMKQEQNQRLLGFKVENENLDIKEMPSHIAFPSTFECHERENHSSSVSGLADGDYLEGHSPLFYSQSTSAPNYFSAATDFPIGGMEFSIDPVDLDQGFPFNIPGFFT